MDAILTKLLAVYITMGIPCADAIYQVNPSASYHGLYILTKNHISILQFKEQNTTTEILAHELAHCGMAQFRDIHEEGRQPPSFDMQEEMKAVMLSHKALELAHLRGNESWSIPTSRLPLN